MTLFKVFLRLVGMKVIFKVLMMLFNQTPFVLSSQGEFRFGLIGQVESNRLKIENADNRTELNKQSGVYGASGLYAALNLNKYSFIDASVLLSSAKYMVNNSRLNASFIDADKRFTQTYFNYLLIRILHKLSTFVNHGSINFLK